MADLNQQAQELSEIMERVNSDLAKFGQLTAKTASDKLDAEVRAKTGITNFTAGMGSATDAVSSLAGSAMSATKAMYDGKKGTAAFNESIDGMAQAATAAGVALTLMIPGGPVIKLLIAGLTAAVGAVASYTKAANEMTDKLYKGFSGMAKTGAAASDGMTGVYKGAKKLGLSMNELDSYVGLVNDSSKDLALFAGSAFEGRKRFEDMGEAMEPFRESLRNAGLSQQEINEGSMSYLRLQTRIGMAQNKTTNELADGARKYLIEMDGLSKLTGMSRKEMEDQMEAARSEQRFRAKLDAMRASGDQQQIDAADKLEKANIMIASQSKEMAQGFRDVQTGMIGTEAAQKALIGTNGEVMRSSQQLQAGQIDQYDAVTRIGKAAGQFAKDMNMSAQLGVFNDLATDYAGQVKLGIFADKDKAEMAKLIAKEQEDQGMKGKKAADALQQSYNELIAAQQKANKATEDFVFKGTLAATNAMKTMATTVGDSANALTSAFDALTNAVNRLLNLFGMGVETPESRKEKQKYEENTRGQGALGSALSSLDVSAEGSAIMEAAEKGPEAAPKESDTMPGWMKSLFPWLAPSAGKPELEARVAGGPVVGKTPYLVGEAGPELFVPSMAGDIVPTNKLAGTTGAAVQRSEAVERAGQEILKDTERLVKLTDTDTERAKKYSIFYENYINKKTEFMQDELDEIQKAVDIKETTGTTGGSGIMSALSGLFSNMGLSMPSMPSFPGMGGGTGVSAPKSSNDLSKMGLKIKTGDVQAEGASINPKILEMASQIQANMPNFAYFSSFNDKFHQEKAPSSSHTKGLAMDFALSKAPSKEEGQEIVKYLKSMGASLAIDEYNNPSSNATAGHIHAQIPGYADGGIAKTPQIAMVAEKGPEAMIPLVNGAVPIKFEMPTAPVIPSEMANGGTAFDNDALAKIIGDEFKTAIKDMSQQSMRNNDSGMMEMLASMLSDMVRAQRDSNDIQSKILQVSTN
jgi:hypothetical protein